MLVFPQLQTGAPAMYPVRHTQHVRTVVNEAVEGQRFEQADADVLFEEWDWLASGLTRSEVDALEALYESAGGSAGTFVFLDPVGNLLARSEEFGDAVWNPDPLLQLTPGVADPWETLRATQISNGSGADQRLTQTLDVPCSFQFNLSLWVRGAGFELCAGSRAEAFPASSEWVRRDMRVAQGTTGWGMDFGIRLAGGSQVEIAGAQVECQPGMTDYKRKGARGGVHSKARFAEDCLTVRALGTDVFEARVRVVSVRG